MVVKKLRKTPPKVFFLSSGLGIRIIVRGWWQLKYVFYFQPLKIGEMIQRDEHIFQRGWNHQPDSLLRG